MLPYNMFYNFCNFEQSRLSKFLFCLSCLNVSKTV